MSGEDPSDVLGDISVSSFGEVSLSARILMKHCGRSPDVRSLKPGIFFHSLQVLDVFLNASSRKTRGKQVNKTEEQCY